MELPGYISIYVRLSQEGDASAKELTEKILKYGVRDVKEVKNDRLEGEYVFLNSHGLKLNPLHFVYFVGKRLDTGLEVVEAAE